MKKIFTLTLLAILGMSSAWADEVTMKHSLTTTANMEADGSNEAATFGLDASAWSVTADKGGANNAPGLNKAGDFRLYWHANGGNTITVSSLTGATITSIAMTFNGASYSNASVTVEGNAVSGTDGNFAINSRSFTIGNGNTSNAQVRISQIVITYTAGAPDTKQTTTVVLSDDYTTKATPGKDAMLALPTATVKAGDATVAGATVTWSSSDESLAKINGSNIELVNPTEGGIVTITASYAGDDTYRQSSASYKLSVYKGYFTLAEMLKDVTSGDTKWNNGVMVSYWGIIEQQSMTSAVLQVVYANGKNTYINDGQNNMLLYGSNLELTAGQLITGDLGNGQKGAIYGTLKLYNGLPEFEVSKDDIEFTVYSDGPTPTPTEITIDKLGENVNGYLTIKDAEYVSANGKTLTFKVGETEFAVYNQWSMNIDDLVAGAKYTLTGMGSKYKENYQLYLISFNKTSDATAISAVKAAAWRNGTIYNMAGQVVNRGYKGLVIINGKKVVMK